MAGLSTIRLHGIKGSLRVPSEVNWVNSLKVSLGVFSIILTSLAIAIAPIIGGLENFFVNGVKFADELIIFIGTQDKRQILTVIEAYYGRMKETTVSWKTLLKIVRSMYSHDERYTDHTETITKLDFYGNDGVCLFKYFVKEDDPQKKFVWTILAGNFICFLFIAISYISISLVSKHSSKNLASAQNKSQISRRILV